MKTIQVSYDPLDPSCCVCNEPGFDFQKTITHRKDILNKKIRGIFDPKNIGKAIRRSGEIRNE